MKKASIFANFCKKVVNFREKPVHFSQFFSVFERFYFAYFT